MKCPRGVRPSAFIIGFTTESKGVRGKSFFADVSKVMIDKYAISATVGSLHRSSKRTLDLDALLR
ncbi:MAG: hypothetical protein WCJ72_05370 [Chryseobacterium sp.]